MLMRTSFGRSAARFIGFCLCVPLLLLLFDAIALPAPQPRKILLLHSQEHETAPFADFEEAFRKYVGQESSDGVQFYEVSVQTDQGTDQEALLSYTLWRFRKEPPALIVPLGGPAAEKKKKN